MVGFKLEFIFCFHFVRPVLKSIEKNSFLLFEKYIEFLSKTKSEFFNEKEFSIILLLRVGVCHIKLPLSILTELKSPMLFKNTSLLFRKKN